MSQRRPRRRIVAARARRPSASSCRRGDLPTPARGSASTSRPAAATTIEEKCSDAGQVHALTGACPTVALHVQWDFPGGLADVESRARRRAAAPASNPAPSTRMSSRTRTTSSDRSATPIREVRAARARALRRERRASRGATEVPRPVAVVCRRVELSRAPPASASGNGGSRKGCRRVHAALGSGSADAGGIQAVRAGVLPHRYRRLGHGAAAGARGRAAGQGARRHRPSLPVAEHRADRRVAARRGACSAASTSTIAATPTTT